MIEGNRCLNALHGLGYPLLETQPKPIVEQVSNDPTRADSAMASRLDAQTMQGDPGIGWNLGGGA
jgi:hypothetical protein